MLLCIATVGKNVRRLNLCGCVGMTGQGLAPLRGSTTIEQIDLSMSKQHGPPLGEDAVMRLSDRYRRHSHSQHHHREGGEYAKAPTAPAEVA
ncbi:hypothetical protein ACHAXR_010316 [Thalassiosira sp. AJA248-18]